MNDAVAASYAYCQHMARRSASNFYYCFYLLPREKRRAMCAWYAYLRETDDLGDSPLPIEQRRAALAQWRSEVEAALRGEASGPILPAVVDAVRRFAIPHDYLLAVLDGVQMDLDERSYATFEELEQYCYRVASVVGLACIHIWGFSSPAAIEPAVQCGTAFQLTNILRDLDEDARRGRVYLPLEDMARCDYGFADLKNRVNDERFRRLLQMELGRAEKLYQAAAELSRYLHPDGRRVFGAMFDTYYELLTEIRRRPDELFARRLRVGRGKKLRIALRWLFARSGAAPAIALEGCSPP